MKADVAFVIAIIIIPAIVAIVLTAAARCAPLCPDRTAANHR